MANKGPEVECVGSRGDTRLVLQSLWGDIGFGGVGLRVRDVDLSDLFTPSKLQELFLGLHRDRACSRVLDPRPKCKNASLEVLQGSCEP